MIVKSNRTESGDVYTICWEFLQAYKEQHFKQPVLENQGKK
jgi:hypothetical protein